ncbi:MAG: hypothetical protein M1820_008592 [Bogoriella megaspora]|nr:MAG: hypothetical protein M1820_008592 [Bogoriella megaspora]
MDNRSVYSCEKCGGYAPGNCQYCSPEVEHPYTTNYYAQQPSAFTSRAPFPPHQVQASSHPQLLLRTQEVPQAAQGFTSPSEWSLSNTDSPQFAWQPQTAFDGGLVQTGEDFTMADPTIGNVQHGRGYTPVNRYSGEHSFHSPGAVPHDQLYGLSPIQQIPQQYPRNIPYAALPTRSIMVPPIDTSLNQNIRKTPNWVTTSASGNSADHVETHSDTQDLTLEQGISSAQEPDSILGQSYTDTTTGKRSPIDAYLSDDQEYVPGYYSPSRPRAELAQPPNEEKYPCEHCSKSFPSKNALKGHQRAHATNKDRPKACPVCAARFLWDKDLRRHLLKHEEHRPEAKYLCPQTSCQYYDKGFARKDHFKRHLLQHYPKFKESGKGQELNQFVDECEADRVRRKRAKVEAEEHESSSSNTSSNPQYESQQALMGQMPTSSALPSMDAPRVPFNPIDKHPGALQNRPAPPLNTDGKSLRSTMPYHTYPYQQN